MITEKAVARFWGECQSAAFRTDGGKVVRVISPGRVSHHDGGDFSDCVMEIDEKRLTGKVEIHVFSDLWKKHGHEIDPIYNGVIMHIAMWRNGRLPVRSSSGELIPTIILSENLDSGIYSFLSHKYVDDSRYVCRDNDSLEMLNLLQKMGLQWFDEKVINFRQMLLTRDPQQLLFQRIARALGYAGNGDTFEKLAERLPLNWLLQNTGNDVTAIQSCLFGMAGLLPSQRRWQVGLSGHAFYMSLEDKWATLRGINIPIGEKEWSFTNLRPENHPCRRLAGLAYLVQRYALDGFLKLVSSPLYTLKSDCVKRSLENRLTVEEDEYWSSHSDFSALLSKKCALIGRGKVGEIILNAILPFRMAYRRYSGKLNGDNSRQLFSSYPALPENRIIRFMKKELGIRCGENLTACQQQGMLYLYREYCRIKDCFNCPLCFCRN